MRTGRYRLRRGFGNKSVLQCEYDSPSLIAGQIDSSIRTLNWYDVAYDDLSNIRVEFLAIEERTQTGSAE